MSATIVTAVTRKEICSSCYRRKYVTAVNSLQLYVTVLSLWGTCQNVINMGTCHMLSRHGDMSQRYLVMDTSHRYLFEKCVTVLSL